MTYRYLDVVREALSEVTERTVGALTGEMQLDRDFDLDSVMFVHFLLSLEDRIPGLQFSPDVLAEAAFNRVSLLLEFLETFAGNAKGQGNESSHCAA
ncbi:phosphopantetheine-binding protein [Agrobacterium vitis]|uniref:phosphopantetheine-binding protein n=1 Tax=Agrobacterium vitis TaxID=373 RepID=UPI003D2D80FB